MTKYFLNILKLVNLKQALKTKKLETQKKILLQIV